LPVGAVILATLFILRGLSLGIPYVSPRVQQTVAGETKVDCCHQAESSSVLKPDSSKSE
jgi:hypothetical protein